MVVRKILANCNELSLSSLITTRHSRITLHLKTTMVYFIITCGIKMVCLFTVSSVVRVHKYKDVCNAPNDGT